MHACPNCGHDAAPRESRVAGPRTDVARVASAAEAGYLVALLEEAGVAAVSRPDESFNAATGEWVAAYRLSVPEDDVVLAAQVLRDEAASQAEELASEAAAAGAVNPWKMLGVLAVVVAAGAVWTAERNDGPLRPRAAGMRRPAFTPLAALSQAVGPRGAEFVAEPMPNEPDRRLRYDPAAKAWVLSIDADHDGRFERRLRFEEKTAAPGGVDPRAAGG
ncbi:hypothetical protein [Botrimarina sp.]|uniref:hypothetical protein n=1 Tax=Botrimarina sp. TaxID=2795802 RepID=UPI0032EF831C